MFANDNYLRYRRGGAVVKLKIQWNQKTIEKIGSDNGDLTVIIQNSYYRNPKLNTISDQ